MPISQHECIVFLVLFLSLKVAYAYINHYLSVYNDYWCQRLTGQMHELGTLGRRMRNSALLWFFLLLLQRIWFVCLFSVGLLLCSQLTRLNSTRLDSLPSFFIRIKTQRNRTQSWIRSFWCSRLWILCRILRYVVYIVLSMFCVIPQINLLFLQPITKTKTLSFLHSYLRLYVHTRFKPFFFPRCLFLCVFVG